MNLKKTNKAALLSLQQSYYKSFVAPLDDMWELGIVAKGQFYEILNNGRIGYLVVNAANELVEYYILPEHQLKELEILSYCLEKLEIKKAHASSYEPNYLGLCLSLSHHHYGNGLLYCHHEKKEISKPDDDIIEVIATHEMLNDVITYTLKDMKAPLEWLKTYYLYLLETKSLILFKLNDVIIATGEMRPSQTSKGYANLGMTVSSDYRYKGLGSYVLNDMVKRTYAEGLVPICGTNIKNIGSQKTISKCGFKVYHRVFTIQF